MWCLHCKLEGFSLKLLTGFASPVDSDAQKGFAPIETTGFAVFPEFSYYWHFRLRDEEQRGVEQNRKFCFLRGFLWKWGRFWIGKWSVLLLLMGIKMETCEWDGISPLQAWCLKLIPLEIGEICMAGESWWERLLISALGSLFFLRCWTYWSH